MDILAKPDALQVGEQTMPLSGNATFETMRGNAFADIWGAARELGRKRGIEFDYFVTTGTFFNYFTGTSPHGTEVARIPREDVEAHMKETQPQYSKALVVVDDGLEELASALTDLGLGGLRAVIRQEIDALHRQSHMGPPKLVIGVTPDYRISIQY